MHTLYFIWVISAIIMAGMKFGDVFEQEGFITVGDIIDYFLVIIGFGQLSYMFYHLLDVNTITRFKHLKFIYKVERIVFWSLSISILIFFFIFDSIVGFRRLEETKFYNKKLLF